MPRRDPAVVVTAVENWQATVIQGAETGLRDAVGPSDLDNLLNDRLVQEGNYFWAKRVWNT